MNQVYFTDPRNEWYNYVYGAEKLGSPTKDLFTQFSNIPELNFNITPEFVVTLDKYCRSFETKGENGTALNSPLLGVVPIYFTGVDRQILFSLCGVEESVVTNAIRRVEYIQPSWVVLNDAYNQLVIWLCHRILTSKLGNAQIETGLMALLKLLHYKFFTSIVFHSYRYGADRATMEATINSLSNKYDVVTYKTWKGVIEARSKDVFDPSVYIHIDTLRKYDDDEAICYILSDVQSRLRSKIRLITEIYYKNVEEGNQIGSYGTVDQIDGEKIIVSQSNVFDTMVNGMIVQCQNPSRFIDTELIRVLCTKFQYVSDDALRRILIMFAELGSMQAQSNELYATKKPRGGEEFYVGVGLIVRELIQKTYRLCILDKVNMNSKTAILVKTMNLYTSSRVTDPDVLILKRSLYNFVLGCGESVREATNSSIVIAIIMYVMIRSFAFL